MPCEMCCAELVAILIASVITASCSRSYILVAVLSFRKFGDAPEGLRAINDARFVLEESLFAFMFCAACSAQSGGVLRCWQAI
jgi:hypothetical protein